MMNRKRKIAIWAVSVLAVIFIATGPGMVRAWRQKKVVDRVFADYSAALVRKDFVRAYDQCSHEFRSSTPYSDFVLQQSKLSSALGDLKTVRQGSTIVEGRGTPVEWTALVNAELIYEKGTAKFIYEFHYSDAGWRLFGYKQL